MKNIILILILFFISCTPKTQIKPARISLINNHQSVKFSGLDPAIIGEISRDSISGIWEALLPVYRMPADTGLKDYQPVQHGRYLVKDTIIVFTPDTPFVTGKTYFMRYYHFGDINDVGSFIRQKNRLGSVPYNDLIFK